MKYINERNDELPIIAICNFFRVLLRRSINEPDLNLNISNIIDFQSPIFHSTGIYFNDNNNEREEVSSEDEESDVNEIITSRLGRMQV